MATLDSLRVAVIDARGGRVSLAGGRHAMGGGQDYACIVFNLHTPHTPDGVARSSTAFRRLIDLVIERGGSYYLTYHRWADAEQVLACYPQLPGFLALKRHYDPDELFSSDWYQHHVSLLAASCPASGPAAELPAVRSPVPG